MKTIHSIVKPVTLAIISVLCIPLAHAELVDQAWVVQSGDGLYRIARQLAPKDLKMQARIRTEISRLNPTLNPEGMEIGMTLRLPEFLFKQPEPAPVVAPAKLPEPPAPMQVSQVAAATPDPAEIIGKVVIQSGSMLAENRGSTRQLNRTASILKGDTLKTAGNARSQIRLKDGALLAISPGTELKFEDFAYNGSEDGTERSVINLIKGGFRTITGAIGHVNKQNYQVKTSVATIGIRGTHYGLMLCEGGSCQNNSEAGNLNDGLYGGVVDGSIVTENDTGQSTFNNDQYFQIQSAQSRPIETLLPPPIFNDTPVQDDKSDNKDMANGDHPKGPNGNQPGGQDGKNPGPNGMGPNGPGQPGGPGPKDGMLAGNFQFNHNPMMMDVLQGGNPLPPPGTSNLNPNQPPPPPITATQNLPHLAAAGSGLAISFAQFDQQLALMDGVAAPIIVSGKNTIRLEQQTINNQTMSNLPFEIHEEHYNIDQVTVYETHDAKLLRADGSGSYDPDSLGGSSLGVNWGRWKGNYVLTETRSDINNGAAYGLTHDVYAHFIYSDHVTPTATIATLGGLKTQMEFYTYFGGTVPTLTSYNGGVFNAAPVTLSATQPIKIGATLDFVTGQLLDYQLSISNTAADNWQASLSAPVNFADLENNSFNLFGTTTLGSSLNGEASLIFVGNQAGAAMTSYSLWYTDTSSVQFGLNGVGILAPPGTSAPNNSAGLFTAANTTTQLSFEANVNATSRDTIYTALVPNDPAIATDDVMAPVMASSKYIDAYQNTRFTANPSQAMATQNSMALAGATINWGHWDTANITIDSSPFTAMTHFIGSNNVTTVAQLGGLTAIGSPNYTVNSSDASFNGVSVVATNVTVNMTADFVTQNITAYNASVSDGVNPTITGYLHTANQIPFASLSNNFSLVNSAGCTGCSARGVANVQFIGSQAEGAITSFALSDGTNSAAGVALLAR
jgi:hypothetical protein